MFDSISIWKRKRKKTNLNFEIKIILFYFVFHFRKENYWINRANIMTYLERSLL